MTHLHHKSGSERFREGEHYAVDSRTGCWEWLGMKIKGYGRHAWKHAHREVWLDSGRPLVKGESLHHRCENPGCVNPDHLEPTDHAEHLKAHMQFKSALDWDDVNQIRSAFAAGATLEELTELYAIGKSQVHNILINHNWHDPDFMPGRPTTCPECGDDFMATKANQRFCCVRHRKRFYGRSGRPRLAA